MKTLNLMILFLLFFASFSIQCGYEPSEAQALKPLPDRDPELARQLVEEEEALILDVRTREEYSSRHLPGSKNIPVQELPDRIQEVEDWVEHDKDRPIVVHCQSGKRSTRAKQILQDSGFGRVTNLGGIDDWPSKE